MKITSQLFQAISKPIRAPVVRPTAKGGNCLLRKSFIPEKPDSIEKLR